MFRHYGKLTGSGLLAATMWLVNMTSAQESPFDQPASDGKDVQSGTVVAPATQHPFTADSASSDVGRRRVDD